ncbi:sensor histidine kinase [Chitinophaga sp. 30R24]|uniref:sensor histidine kinase n=1 Tax=Chitinophaga sp. 30R24 TaxID=3248838 RepID=UPI003B918B62
MSYIRFIYGLFIVAGLLYGIPRAFAQGPQLPGLLHELSVQQDSTQYVNTLGKIGALYMMMNIDSCFLYALKEQEIAGRIRYTKGIADAYDLMSFCFALRTDFNIASIYAYRALQLHRAMSDSARICKTLSNLYLYYRNQGRVEDANNYFYEAFQMASRLPPSEDSIHSILLVNYVMRFYKDIKRKDSVLWALQTARAICGKYPWSRLKLYIDAYGADSLVKQGRGAAAEARINALAGEALHRGLPYVAMDIYNRLEDYQQMGYATDSTHYRVLSYQLAKEAGCEALNLPVLAGLYDYYQAQKDTASIGYYSREVMRLAKQPRYQPGYQVVNYIDYFLKEQRLQQLAHLNQLQQQQLEVVLADKRNSQRVLAGVFIVVLLLVILLFSRYRHYRLARFQEQLLAESYAGISLKNVQLRANDEFKNKLITIIANDFRAPLRRISSIAQRLKEEDTDPIAMTILMKDIAAASGSTLSVFDNILKWIRLQLSGFVYEELPCRLYDITQALLKITAGAAAEKAVVVKNLVPQDFVLQGDGEMLHVVQLHLLRLSIQYALPGSLVIITAWEESGVAYFRFMADAGPEAAVIIASLADWQHDMFALSYAITSDFVTKMKGTVQITESEGKYLVFTCMLKGGYGESYNLSGQIYPPG